MKRHPWFVALVLLLAACQPQTTVTSVLPANGPTAAASATKSGAKTVTTQSLSLPTEVPGQPGVHRSSPDPNAPNLIVVRDQPVANNSVTIDSVTASQAGWVVLFLEKKGQPGHQIGFVPVPAGKSQNLILPLTQNTGVDVSPTKLAGELLFVLLQAGPNPPGAPVQVQGRSVVSFFRVLSAGKP
jgi:hypothetical protein